MIANLRDGVSVCRRYDIGNQQQDGGGTRDERASRREPDYATELRKYKPREQCVVERVVRPRLRQQPRRRSGVAEGDLYHCNRRSVLHYELGWSRETSLAGAHKYPISTIQLVENDKLHGLSQ
jgi:hypothetical protein